MDFQEPLDHALATRLIRVTDDANTAVSGELRLEDRERRWLFVPARNWNPGDYSVVVWTTIEDLAGNNIGKPFEVSMEDDAPRFANTPVKVGFRVK